MTTRAVEGYGDGSDGGVRELKGKLLCLRVL